MSNEEQEVSAFREGDQGPDAEQYLCWGPSQFYLNLEGHSLGVVAGSQLAHSWRVRVEPI